MTRTCWRPLLALVAALLAAGTCAAQQALPELRVAVVLDGPVANQQLGPEPLEDEIRRATRGKFLVRFPSELRLSGDWTQRGVELRLDEALARSDVDLVIAFGAIGSNDLARRRSLPVPSLALRVIDAELQGIPFEGPGSGVRNLSYLAAPVNLRRDIEAFRELVEFQRLAIVLPGWVEEALPLLVDGLTAELDGMGMDYRRVPFVSSAAETLAAIPEDVEAVYVASLAHVPTEELDLFVAGLVERRLPSFSLLGRDDVERGLMACLTPDTKQELINARAAEYVLRILSGEEAGTLPPMVTGRERLTINLRTARAIEVWPRFETLTEADFVGGPATGGERVLSLGAVMREALLANRGYLASEASLRAAEEDIDQARAPLLPQVDLGAGWRLIDEDQALLGRAERTLSVGLTGSQLLWSEGTRANLDVQEHVFASREFDHQAVELDVVVLAAVAYLDVLRAKTLERIVIEDLKLTRSNLDLAQVRRDLGVSGPSEVYRWESRIATSRQAVLDARANRRVMEIELNRLLNRPLEEEFETEDVGLDGAGVRVDERLRRFIDNPFTFEVFRDFQVEHGLIAAPELLSLNEAIRAQERLLLSTKRAHWQPTLALDGALEDVLETGGDGAVLPAGLSGIVPDPEQTTWNVGLLGSFDLLTGGTKKSRERQARYQLIRLRLEREATSELVEQRIRSSMHFSAASYAGIGLSRDAAEAATKNLELVTDSYSRGVVSIIDLLDAQNAALVAEQSAANAIYDFVIDFMQVQRSVGRFDLYASEASRERWFRDLDAYFAARLGEDRD